MPLGTEVGLSPGHTVLDGVPAPPILAHVCCGQTAGGSRCHLVRSWYFGPGHIVLDGDPAPPLKGAQQPPLFGRCLLWPRSPISATAELLLHEVLNIQLHLKHITRLACDLSLITVGLHFPDFRYFLANVKVRYMLSPVRLSSVVCLSVTLVHATQPVEIFRNVSTPVGTLTIR